MFAAGLGACLVVASLALPWVQAWTPALELEPVSGMSVLRSVASGDPWQLLAIGPAVSVVTMAAWFVRRDRLRRAIERIVWALVATVTVAFLLVAAWSGLDIWPDALSRRIVGWLSPGFWWVSGGVVIWGFGQAACMLALHQQSDADESRARRHRWSVRPGANMVGAPLPNARLALLPARVRDLTVDAHRLRAELEAPLEPLRGRQLESLLDLVADLCSIAADERTAFDRAGLDADAIVRDLTPSSRALETGWFDELRRLDGALYQLVSSVLRLPRPGYR
jgi:hypothetical protein